MDEDELVGLVRVSVEGRELTPASAADVAEVEAAVGAPMPPLLRRIYLEVADGGFGCSHGALSLIDRPGHLEGMLDWYRKFRLPRLLEANDGHGDEPYIHPRSVVPLVELGCAMWVHVEFGTPDGRTWRFDPNRGCERHFLHPEPFTLAERLLDWVRGDGRLEPNRHCRLCRE